jgi:hypothetical protein
LVIDVRSTLRPGCISVVVLEAPEYSEAGSLLAIFLAILFLAIAS